MARGRNLPPPPSFPKKEPPGSAWENYVRARPQLRPWAATIVEMSKRWGVDRYNVAALILWESGGRANARGDGGNSFGLGQINVGRFGGSTPFGTVSRENALNPRFAIQYIAWQMSEFQKETGSSSVRDFYLKNWNPGHDPAQGGPWGKLPKGHVPGGTQGIPGSLEETQIKADITDPFVGIKNGKLRAVKDPKFAIKSFGLPVRMSDFRRFRSQLDDTYLAYTGRRAKDAEVVDILRKGTSEYQLINGLTKRPEFLNSPTWKSRAPGYEAAWREVMGPGNADKELIRQALVNNWDGNTFAAAVRKRPEYLGSNEFQGLYSQYEGVFRSIYGAPTEADKQTVQEIALAGWGPDQFKTWLRQQDGYKHSPEALTKSLVFLEALGLVTGGTPVLKSGGAVPTNVPSGSVPDDPRVQGQATGPTRPAMTATFDG